MDETKGVGVTGIPNSGILFSAINCEVKGYRSLSASVREKRCHNGMSTHEIYLKNWGESELWLM